jgi:type VI secretion system protein ImpM
MRCGLFGKMPSKGDFVSYGMERPFLDLWENWLQTGVATSREQLGERWQEVYLHAPIWRFWLGGGIAGSTVAGALMASVDKVGRYFPLSVCAVAPPGFRIAPPPEGGLEQWFSAVEPFLLHMLEDELEDDPATLAAALPPPPLIGDMRSESSVNGRMLRATDGRLDGFFNAIAAEDHATLFGQRSYWWTHGGATVAPQLMVQAGMAAPGLFAELLQTTLPMSMAS